ncbi:MAG: excinuclease ABC subunit UvrC, partial [Lachnospiraceae bacterium]|nr:excinuclease ABC subunit UvrC [Lachnospiraceae bacterium]
DKTYPYIRIDVKSKYPTVYMTRRMLNDCSKYFGPYTNAKAVKDIIELLNRIYKLRTCNKRLPKEIGKDRPCLYYQIGQCNAPCNSYISVEDYNANIQKAIDFLNGDYKETLVSLNKDMKKYAADMEFEKAAEIRDLIDSINHITDKQKMNNTNGEDRDVIAFASNENDTVVSVFFVREGKLLGREHHHMNVDISEEPAHILNAFVEQFYSGTPYLPKEIVVPLEIEDQQVIESYLSGRRGSNVRIIVPQKGDKHKMLKLAEDNARLVLEQDMERIKRQEKRTIGATQEIAKLLGIESAKRMEAFDISNISGTLSVASMVVFENGKPKKNAYRKFRLKTVTGPDDYASMKEVLSRRFTDEKLDVLPDVIMMDGGKGQVNVALMVLDSLGLEIPVCGMVKDDNHRTRALYFNNKEVEFSKGSEAILMITALQDEAHRFAIEYHKQLRRTNQVRSILDEIPGVGPSRRKALLKYFKDIDNIREASLDELESLPEIPKSTAGYIYRFFHE